MYNFDKPKRGRPKQPLSLSVYRKQIILLLMQGYSGKEIASQLKRRHNAIGRTMFGMMEHFKVTSSIALVIKCIQLGFVDPADTVIRERTDYELL